MEISDNPPNCLIGWNCRKQMKSCLTQTNYCYTLIDLSWKIYLTSLVINFYNSRNCDWICRALFYIGDSSGPFWAWCEEIHTFWSFNLTIFKSHLVAFLIDSYMIHVMHSIVNKLNKWHPCKYFYVTSWWSWRLPGSSNMLAWKMSKIGKVLYIET